MPESRDRRRSHPGRERNRCHGERCLIEPAHRHRDIRTRSPREPVVREARNDASPPINANNSDMTAMESRTTRLSHISRGPPRKDGTARWRSTSVQARRGPADCDQVAACNDLVTDKNRDALPDRRGRRPPLELVRLCLPTRQAILPQSQIKASAPSGQPLTGGRPVQFGYRSQYEPGERRPDIPEHRSHGRATSSHRPPGYEIAPDQIPIHRGTDSAGHSPARKNSGESPLEETPAQNSGVASSSHVWFVISAPMMSRVQ